MDVTEMVRRGIMEGFLIHLLLKRALRRNGAVMSISLRLAERCAKPHCLMKTWS